MNPFKNIRKYFGPGTLIAAAFIGPGTLTTCTLAGVETGYGLLWVMVFAIIATIILQEMAARLGFVTGSGLGEAIRRGFPTGLRKYLAFFIVLGAIVIGNAAYEAGNMAGGILGIELLAGPSSGWPLILGAIAFIILFMGRYKLIENFLVGLVLIMSLCFLITAIVVRPDLSSILAGLIPRGITEDYLLILGLVGTTIVPYNLFLHASAVTKKASSGNTLRDIRIENRASIILGGFVSVLIIITAAAGSRLTEQVQNAADLAVQLEPLAGSYATYLMGLGLFSAGLSSALTAPLAAGWAAAGLFGWPPDDRSWRFRGVWMTVLASGILVAMSGLNAIVIIKFAQVMNAILLPLVAGYLVYVSNRKEIMGNALNSTARNIAAGVILLLLSLLSIRSFWRIAESL